MNRVILPLDVHVHLGALQSYVHIKAKMTYNLKAFFLVIMAGYVEARIFIRVYLSPLAPTFGFFSSLTVCGAPAVTAREY